MPERFHFQRSDPDVILPQRFPGNLQSRNADYFYFGIARLKPGVTLAQANGDVARMLPLWDKKTMEVMRMGPALRSLKEDVVGDIGSVLWVLMGTVGMVLLIACANVANLLLVRTAGRQRELAIRSALGAGWYQIVREMLLENLALGFCGGVFGLLLAFGGLRLLIVLRPANLPRLNEIVIDPLTLIVLGATSLLSALLFGLIPAVRQAAPHIAMMLGSGGRTASQSRERQRSQNTLVVVQVALALVLLVAAGLMIRTFQALVSVQPGVTQPDQLQIARISIPQAQVASPDGVVRMQNDILERIAAIPGVVSAGFATAMPTEDPQNRNLVTTDNTLDAQLAPIRVAKNISPGLLKTQGTPLLAGRDFTWTDIYEKRPVAIVSERLAQESWGGVEAALGRRIRLGVVGEWREIVGVAGNVYDEGVNQKPSATIYWRAGEQQGIFGAPNSAPRSIAFAIRTNRAGTESFLNELRQAVWSVNPNLPLSQVRTLGDILSRSIARTSFTLVMLAIAGLMALVLGVVGIYGVMSYSVSQRTREIGIRLAFGAQQHSIKRRFVCQGLLLAFAGVAIGLAAAVPLTRLMTSLLFGVQPLDPITLAVVAAILAIAAASASYLPARRVSAVDPVEALKAE
jgi:predicted permease